MLAAVQDLLLELHLPSERAPKEVRIAPHHFSCTAESLIRMTKEICLNPFGLKVFQAF